MSAPIVTLTMNPTVDVASEADGVRPGHKIRTTRERLDPGGGGVNVTRVIGELGGTSVAVIASGGITGRYLQELLDEHGITWVNVPIAGRTRLCGNVHDRRDNQEYRFVPEGPLVGEAEWRGALTALDAMQWQWLVGSGSLPRGVPDDFYVHTARLAARRGGYFVLDTSGPALRAALGAGVALLKPSLSELEYLAGHPIPKRTYQADAARQLVQGGAARMVALTLAEEGALLALPDRVIHMPAPPVPVRSSVGAGDGFVAAMVLSLARGDSPEDALAWGIAAGAAVTASDGTASLRPEVVAALFAQARGRAEVLAA